MRRRFRWLPLAFLGFCLPASPLPPSDAKLPESEFFTVEKVADGVYAALARPGPKTVCNAGIVVTDRETVVLDSHMTVEAGKDLVRVAGLLSDKPLRYLVHSHFHGDHVNGSPAFGPDVEIVGHPYTKEQLEAGKSPGARIPTVTLTETWTLHRPGLTVKAVHPGPAHTRGDVALWIPERKVLVTGDSFVSGPFNFWGDADLPAWPKAIAVYESLKPEKIIPGHGAVVGGDMLPKFRAYLDAALRSIRDLVAAGKDQETVTKEFKIPDEHAFFWPEGMRAVNLANAYHAARAGLNLPPRVGDLAPDFQLPASTGGTFHLQEALSKGPVVLSFHPLDWTGVCTKQACGLRDRKESLAALKAQVAGISIDTIPCHQQWAKEHAIPYPLLSDANREVIRSYGIVHEELAGIRGVSKRAVFVIAPTGRIAYAWVSDDPGVMPDLDAAKAAVEAMRQ